MDIGTYSDGRTVTYNEATREFAIEGVRTTSALLARYDKAGQVTWGSGELRSWVHEYAEGETADSFVTAQSPRTTTVAGGWVSEQVVTPASTNVIGRRYLAFAIDWMIVGTGVFVLAIAAGIVLAMTNAISREGVNQMEPVISVIGNVLVLSYFIMCEAVFGTTPGKKLFGLRVLSVDGDPISPLQAIVRNVLLPIDLLFFTIPAVVTMGNSELHQRIGDHAAKTVVVSLR